MKCLDVIYLVKDGKKCKDNITKILNEAELKISERTVEKEGYIKFPWVAVCGAGCKNIWSSLPKLFVPEEKLSGMYTYTLYIGNMFYSVVVEMTKDNILQNDFRPVIRLDFRHLIHLFIYCGK